MLGEPPRLRPYGFRLEGMAVEYDEYEWGGETLGEPMADTGAECDMLLFGGGIMVAMAEPCSKAPFCTACWTACWVLLLLLELGLLCILEWRVSSSEREKRLVQPGNWQAWGFSPVCVRI